MHSPQKLALDKQVPYLSNKYWILLCRQVDGSCSHSLKHYSNPYNNDTSV